ncbi:MAG: hypothetical protein E6J34_00980 [Chloroflexi bacterium]|nr:MAG: hypothetical protein E6J34_00980 [Chloroflexota bacterium]
MPVHAFLHRVHTPVHAFLQGGKIVFRCHAFVHGVHARLHHCHLRGKGDNVIFRCHCCLDPIETSVYFLLECDLILGVLFKTGGHVLRQFFDAGIE